MPRGGLPSTRCHRGAAGPSAALRTSFSRLMNSCSSPSTASLRSCRGATGGAQEQADEPKAALLGEERSMAELRQHVDTSPRLASNNTASGSTARHGVHGTAQSAAAQCSAAWHGAPGHARSSSATPACRGTRPAGAASQFPRHQSEGKGGAALGIRTGCMQRQGGSCWRHAQGWHHHRSPPPIGTLRLDGRLSSGWSASTGGAHSAESCATHGSWLHSPPPAPR